MFQDFKSKKKIIPSTIKKKHVKRTKEIKINKAINKVVNKRKNWKKKDKIELTCGNHIHRPTISSVNWMIYL